MSTKWLFLLLASASCREGSPRIDLEAEVSGLEQLITTTDTGIVAGFFSGKGVTIEKAGKTPLYEYVAVGKKQGYEIEYHVSPDAVEAFVITDYDRTIFNSLPTILVKHGYVRGEDEADVRDYFSNGGTKSMERTIQRYRRETGSGPQNFWIQTLEDGMEVVDFAFGASEERFGRIIGGGTNNNPATRPDVRIKLTPDGLFFNKLRVTEDWSIKGFDEALGSTGRWVVKTDSERTAALKKFGKPLRNDIYLYDTLGMHLFVDHATGKISEVSIDFNVGKYSNSPTQPFGGSFLVDQNSMSRKTTLYDLRHFGFKPTMLPRVSERYYGEFKMIFEFDSSDASSKLSSVGISFLSDDIVPRNMYGWSEEDVASQRLLLRNQLEPMIDPAHVDMEQLLDCFCNWMKNNVPITNLSNPSPELLKEIGARSKACTDGAKR